MHHIMLLPLRQCICLLDLRWGLPVHDCVSLVYLSSTLYIDKLDN